MIRCREWRRWIQPLVIVVYGCVLVIALPLMIIEFHDRETDIVTREWFIGGLFVLLALPISLWAIIQHLIHYTQPHLQRHIIRIIWMVPIYAINAWFALKFPSVAIYLDSARECYEAYVIYNFMSYLLNFLRSEYPDLESHLARKRQVDFPPPLCWVEPWKMGSKLVLRCKHGVMQYTVMRPLTTLIAFVCYISSDEDDHKYYGEGHFNFKSAWSYLVIINNFSQIFSMFCLVMFYKATREELAPMRPISKFLCVKAVVFMSFWQGVLIAILQNCEVFKGEETIGKTLQDFCICIEMFIAAVAHYYSFSHRPFIDYAADPQDCCASFRSMWDVSDVQKDVVEHIRHVGSTATGIIAAPLQGASLGNNKLRSDETEMTPLISAGEESADELQGGHAPHCSRSSHSPDIIPNVCTSPDIVLATERLSELSHTRASRTTLLHSAGVANDLKVAQATGINAGGGVNTGAGLTEPNSGTVRIAAEVHRPNFDLLSFELLS